MDKNRQIGMLLGLHCGDSLGATLEFGDPIEDPSIIHRDIVGGGVLGWNPGAATDDTDLMICVLKSIVKNKFLASICEHKMIEWYDSDPKDIGKTTRVAIEHMINKTSSEEVNLSRSNGSLMRCAPLALLNQDQVHLNASIKAQHDLTHADKETYMADILFVTALKALLSGRDKFLVYEDALLWSETNLPTFHARFKYILTTPWGIVPSSGYVLDTLFAGFWGLLNSDNFEMALIKVVNKGDDADTVGAVTGALCGAHYGYSEIPKRWLDVIEKKDQIVLEYNRIISEQE